MIELHKVSKRFESVVALWPTDLRIPKHRTTVLIGPSGCGKSTMLRLIAELLQPTDGSIEVDGVPATQVDLLEFRRRLGYVIQDGGLFPHLSARDNVLLASQEMRIPPEKAISRLGEPIISGLNLNDHATILQGAVPAAVLAILRQIIFSALDRVLIPEGLRLKLK